MTLESLIDEVIESMAADGLSPFPGFFTVITIAKAVSSMGWEGKAKPNSKNVSGLSRRQLLCIKKYLDDYYEPRHHNGNTYYSKHKIR